MVAAAAAAIEVQAIQPAQHAGHDALSSPLAPYAAIWTAASERTTSEAGQTSGHLPAIMQDTHCILVCTLYQMEADRRETP